MVMKKSEFERLFRLLYGNERRLVMSAVWRSAKPYLPPKHDGVPVLCWQTKRGVGVVVGLADGRGVFDREVQPAKLILKVSQYLAGKQTSQTSQNFTELHKVL